MQGRHRSPVDGLRSAGVGRLSKEGHGGYGGSGYRNFGRGGKYRRGPLPKPSHSYLPPPPPPPPRKIDIMMEAGRLAAEYFVSKGVIPASLLPPKWPSDCVSQDSKGRDRDSSSFHGRTSALDRLGSSNYDSGYGRRRYSDERDHPSQGQQTRGRKKKEGNHRSHGSDWGRDERNDSWDDNRSRYPNENGVEDDAAAAPGYKRSGVYDYYSSSRAFKSAADSEPRSEESEMDNYDGGDDTGSKASSSSTRKDTLPDTDAELMRGMNEGDTSNMEEVDNTRGNENPEQENKDRMDEDSPEQLHIDEDDSGKPAADLLKLCSFMKVPTKLRSSATNRSPIVEDISISAVSEKMTGSSTSPDNDEKPSVVWVSNPEQTTVQTSKTNVAISQDDSMSTEKNVSQLCSGESPSVAMLDTVHLGQEDSAAIPRYSVEEGVNSNAVHAVENRSCNRSLSFPEKFSTPPQRESIPALVLSSENRICARSFSFPQTSSPTLLPEEADKSLDNSNVSLVTTDAAAGDDFALPTGQIGGTKRPREWYSDIVPPNEYGMVRNLRAKQLGSQDNALLPDEGAGTEQKKLTTAVLLQKSEPGCQVNLEEDRRSNSFKICDLNLMEAPEITEIPDDPATNAVHSAAVKETEKVHSVDFGLSISNTTKNNDIYSQHPHDDKGIQIIDLEDDSPVEDGVWDPSKHKAEPMYPNLDNFLNNTVNPVDLPDIPDGYSLATISDLLGADMGGCPSVSADMNSLHPGMALPGAEGIPGDDDSIYVSLGEIPIGFMDVWDPPPQEYGKFF